MTDLSTNTFKTDLNGVLDYAKLKDIRVEVGYATLSQLKTLYTDGGLASEVERTEKYFKAWNTLSITQTAEKETSIEINRLVNIWNLQKSLQRREDFSSFILCSYNHINGRAVLDIHPGRTRMYFANVYNKPIPVMIFNYSRHPIDAPFYLERYQKGLNEYPNDEYFITPDWDIPQDLNNNKYILVQPAHTDSYHWHTLEQDITFTIHYNHAILTHITANDEPFLEFKEWQWRIVI